MRPLGWALIQSDQCPYKKRKLGRKERHQCFTEGRPHEDMVRRRPSEAKGRPPEKPNIPAP